MGEGEVRPFGAVVRDLLLERGMVTPIGNPNWRAFSNELAATSGIGYESLRKALTGDRQPSVKIMEEVARALDVDPEVFTEYQLAQAQRDFDPREVGEEQALANLRAWTKVRRSS